MRGRERKEGEGQVKKKARRRRKGRGREEGRKEGRKNQTDVYNIDEEWVQEINISEISVKVIPWDNIESIYSNQLCSKF